MGKNKRINFEDMKKQQEFHREFTQLRYSKFWLNKILRRKYFLYVNLINIFDIISTIIWVKFAWFNEWNIFYFWNLWVFLFIKFWFVLIMTFRYFSNIDNKMEDLKITFWIIVFIYELIIFHNLYLVTFY